MENAILVYAQRKPGKRICSVGIEGADIQTISSVLGHSNIATTRHYVKSLPDEMLEAISYNLLNFD
jgi:integrase